LHIVALSGFSVDSRNAVGDFDSHLLKPTSVDSIVDFLNALPAPAAD
jgi:hypothetical protein